MIRKKDEEKRPPEECLQDVIRLHSPRTIKIGASYGDKPDKDRETRQLCTGCEVNWWPCLTFKVATGLIVDWEVPIDTTPFGTSAR